MVAMQRNERQVALKGGALAGLAGGLLLVVFAVMNALAMPANAWAAFKLPSYVFFGDRVLSGNFDAAPVALGIALHLLISAAWGVLFALLVYGLGAGATLASGAVFGVVVWLVMLQVVMPIVGLGEVARLAPVSTTLIEHLAFGLALGLAFLPFQAKVPHHPPPIRKTIAP